MENATRWFRCCMFARHSRRRITLYSPPPLGWKIHFSVLLLLLWLYILYNVVDAIFTLNVIRTKNRTYTCGLANVVSFSCLLRIIFLKGFCWNYTFPLFLWEFMVSSKRIFMMNANENVRLVESGFARRQAVRRHGRIWGEYRVFFEDWFKEMRTLSRVLERTCNGK